MTFSPRRRPPEPTPDAATPAVARMVPRTARELAFVALQAYDDDGSFLSDSLDRLQVIPVSPADRALAMELCYTVMRRRLTLDAVLRQLIDRDPEKVERDLWTVLRIGVAQVLLIPGLPVHAAVHETVELAKRANSRWGGMVNGVLRSLQRLIRDDFTDQPSSSGVPLVTVRPADEGSSEATVDVRYRQMSKDVFPDFTRDALGYVSTAFSMPRDLMARWSQGWDAAAALRLAAWFVTPGVMTLRVNLLRGSRESLLETLRAANVSCWAGATPESIRLQDAARIARLPGFDEGLFSVQDESAMSIVDLLDPQPSERILDLCAAPGGKSTHLAERMNDQGTIVACDLSPRRLRMVDDSARRLGLSSISTQSVSEDVASIPAGPFDAAIVDAPCSNMGVLGKRPEARWRLTETDFTELPLLQIKLLNAAADRIRVGGRLAYSTCSIDALENEGVIRAFLGEGPGWTVTKQHQSAPGEPADGGFVTLLTRQS